MYELIVAYAPDGPDAVDQQYVNEVGVNPSVAMVVLDLADDDAYVTQLRQWVILPMGWTPKFYESVAEGLLCHVDINDAAYKAYVDGYFATNAP